MDHEDPGRRVNRICTLRQLELLTEFLQDHRELALGRVRSKGAQELAARLWAQIAVDLNREGPVRSGKEWSKYWTDYKVRVRAKIIARNKSQTQTGGGQPSSSNHLTNIEEQAAQIIGMDFGPLPNVQQNPFANNDSAQEADAEIVAVNVHILSDEWLESPVQIMPVFDEMEELRCEPELSADLPQVPPSAGLPAQPQIRPAAQPRAPRARTTRADRVRAHARSRPRPPVPGAAHSSHISALEEAQSAVIRIEEAKACPEETQSRAIASIAESIRIMADTQAQAVAIQAQAAATQEQVMRSPCDAHYHRARK